MVDASSPLALYLHVPWCRVRCGYCDFNTYVTDTSNPANTAPYVEALRREIALAAKTLGPRWVKTVYVGGGTPSLMSAIDLGRLISSIRRQFDLDDAAEISVEANPESLSPDWLGDVRDLGVNRLSLGMQSAVPAVLATLDRTHTPGRVVEAVDWARRAGFDNISLDLIYGTPGESMDDWETSLVTALALKPDHVSAYSLIVEPGTPLAKRVQAGELAAPNEDELADKYTQADRLLSTVGLNWYEVSNWARPGRECRHNLVYWRSGDWWGLGAGAHSHIDGTRWWNVKRPATYVGRLAQAGSPMQGQETLTKTERHEEMVMLKLRLAEGLAVADLGDEEWERAERYITSGHLVSTGGRLVCTLAGRLIADAIVRDILLAGELPQRLWHPPDLGTDSVSGSIDATLPLPPQWIEALQQTESTNGPVG